MSLGLEQLKHENMDEKVYHAMARQIISGTLKPGTRFTEEEVATRLGISRTPVREALKRLAQDDLVELLPRKGVYVKKLSRQDLAEIYEIRAVLEGLAASLSAIRIPESKLATLKSQAERAKQELSNGGLDAYFDFDANLHATVIEFSGNERLIKMLGSLNNLIAYFRTEVAKRTERAQQALDDHCRVLAALEKRDGLLAQSVMADHIRNTSENILNDIPFDA